MAADKRQDITVNLSVCKLSEAKKDKLAFLSSGYIVAVDDKVVSTYRILKIESQP